MPLLPMSSIAPKKKLQGVTDPSIDASQQGPYSSLKKASSVGPTTNYWQKIKDAIGGATGLPIGDEESATSRTATLGSQLLPSPAMIAYHGTGALPFKKFDLSKMGSGEGAQAYGAGHYFAGNFDIAKDYYEGLKKYLGGLKLGNKRLSGGDIDPKVYDYLNTKTDKNFQNVLDKIGNRFHDLNSQDMDLRSGVRSLSTGTPKENLADAIKGVRDNLASDIRFRRELLRDSQGNALVSGMPTFLGMPNPLHDPLKEMRSLQDIRKQYDMIKQARTQGDYTKLLKPALEAEPQRIQGGIIKAEIPDEAVSRMLQWDQPIKDQPKVVQQYLQQNPTFQMRLAREANTRSSLGPRNVTGQDAFRWAKGGGTSSLAYSQELERAGIPGVKYLSGTARNRVTNSLNPTDFNYVSFSDELPKILDYMDWQKLKSLDYAGKGF